jgi:hypothetical protein
MVTNALRGPFAKHGLSLVQMPEYINGDVFLTTRLLHSSGEWMESDYPIKPVKPDPQGYGSAITYARRYCLMAVAGIAPEDDDGNEASRLNDRQEPASAQPRQQPQSQPQNGMQKPWATRKQMISVFGNLGARYEAGGLASVYRDILKRFGVDSPEMFGDGKVAMQAYSALVADMREREGHIQ